MTAKSNPDLPERYQLIAELGAGAVGIVYKANDTLLSKTVAIKCLQGGNRFSNAFAVRFQKEAKAIGALKHENIVQLLDFGFTDKQIPYMVMEYVEGESLQSRIRKSGPLNSEEGLSVFIQLFDALRHAHAKGIIHRDLKSSNLLLDETGTAKLCDFGVAEITCADKIMDVTRTNAMLGTPTYMSPEQAQGISDQRSDIYSAGCVMYEALTGRVPFLSDTVMEQLEMHRHAAPSVVSRFSRYPVPSFLEEVIERCLEKAPEDRFQSAQEVLDELQSESPDEEPLQMLAKSSEDAPKKEKAVGGLKLALIAALIVAVSSAVVVGQRFNSERHGSSEPAARENMQKGKANVPTTYPRTLVGDKRIEAAGANIEAGYSDSDEPMDPKRFLKPMGVQDTMLLNLAHSRVTPSILAHYATMKNIIGIDLSDCNVDQSCLHVLAQFPSLDYVDLDNTDISLAGLDELHNIHGLQFLTLGEKKDLSRECFRALAKIDKLTSLKIKACENVDGPGLAELRTLPELSYICIESSQLTPGFGKALGSLRNLKRLELDHCEITDDQIDELQSLRAPAISLSGNLISDKSLKKICSIPGLKQLVLIGCPGLTVEGLKKMAANRKIELRYGSDDRAERATDFKKEFLEKHDLKKP